MNPWKDKIHEIIFEADTKSGKFFDVALMIAIILSVLAVMLESVKTIDKEYGDVFMTLEWIFTIIFTVEYVLRLISIKKPWNYATSFYGIVDLLAILPTYLILFLPYDANYLIVIRALRLLRVFRVFKLAQFLDEGRVIFVALRASVAKITVFLVVVFLFAMIFGSLIYVIEGTENSEQFTSIPRSIYWAIVTITTVGYGDISPVTPLGQLVAAVVMLIGYAVIAVPTGIVTMELVNAGNNVTTRSCTSCSQEGHDEDAEYCKYCGDEL